MAWSKNCVLADMTINATANPAIAAPLELEFQITDTKLNVPVVTLSKENDTKLIEQLKTGFNRTIKWNKCRSQMTVHPQNSNLNYLIDPTFTKVNRLFVLSFARNILGDKRDSFPHYYVPNVEIKDFNVLIDGKSFFDFPVKNEEETYERIIKMRNNNDYTTGNSLDFAYFKENYRLITIDLSKQTKLKDPKQISFIGKLSRRSGAAMFFVTEKSEDTTFKFPQNSVTIT